MSEQGQETNQQTDQGNQSQQTQTQQTNQEVSDKTLVNQAEGGGDSEVKDGSKADEKPSPKAPEKYEPFKLPEGMEIPEETFKTVEELFKKLDLDQAGAQSLVDFHAKALKEASEAPFNAYRDLRKSWVDAIKSDPDMGPKIDQVKTDISRLISTIPDKAVQQGLRQGLEVTGAGDHPGVVKFLYEMSKILGEGTHVSGKGPAPVTKPGDQKSAAQKIWGNLQSG